MTTENLFEVALRKKMRFPFKGLISTEDLYDLSVQNLDGVFKALNADLKKASEDSLLNVKTNADKELEIKIEIVKHIVALKLGEQKERLAEKEKKEQKQKILEILASKQEESLHNKSEEELQKMLENL